MGDLKEGVTQVSTDAPGLEACSFEPPRNIENGFGDFEFGKVHLSSRPPCPPTPISSTPCEPVTLLSGPPGSRPCWRGGLRPRRMHRSETLHLWDTGLPARLVFPPLSSGRAPPPLQAGCFHFQRQPVRVHRDRAEPGRASCRRHRWSSVSARSSPTMPMETAQGAVPPSSRWRGSPRCPAVRGR